MVSIALIKARTFSKTGIAVWGLLALYMISALYVLSDYFIANVNTYMGLILAPYILILKKQAFSYRYLLPAIIFSALLFLIPVKTGFFLAFLFGLLFLTESCIGRINKAFFLLLLVLSPLFNYAIGLVGFPIRLCLSSVAGSVLSFAGRDIQVAGNTILMDGSAFAVDPACAGLQMMTTSLIIGLLIIAYYQRKTGKESNVLTLFALLAGVFVLNIIGNLFRIITLIFFKIMPADPFHDVVGILCLTGYVILPLILISARIFRVKHPVQEQQVQQQKGPSFISLGINFMLIAVLFCGGSAINRSAANLPSGNEYDIKGFKKEILEKGITKFENDRALIYLKPLTFYSAEHNPMVCWTGSGYEFTHINTERIDGKELYTGLMEKGADKIYTAWWFDSGSYKTISQADWRWRSAKGEGNFCLVNVNAASREELLEESKKLLKAGSFYKGD